MQIFDEQSKNLIMDWAQSLKNQIKIKLITTEHVETNQFINFTKKFTETTSKLTVDLEKGENDLPCFLLKKNIKYSALPLSKELEPFLEALSHINNHEVKLAEPILQRLDKINIPVNLKLYIALECPHCPNVVRTIIPMAMICENLHLQIIDGTLFPETAQKDGVMSAPCLILDDDFRWTGEVTTQEIIEIIINRDPSQLSAASLKNILEEGDASWIAGQMMEKGEIFAGFIQLLLHETWSVRLGAMVIVEELAETDPKLVAKLCPELIALFDKKDVPVQGDMLYVLGEAGSSETKKWINNKIATLEHQDLIDAANDALETLN
ncbi:MAG: thioredoxin family protein [Deltaproteobacteria bacterium]|jgi:hypothetical protein|nr:thioredoxin family protein [Deltaproteobacteria bacterium]